MSEVLKYQLLTYSKHRLCNKVHGLRTLSSSAPNLDGEESGVGKVFPILKNGIDFEVLNVSRFL